MSAADSRDPLQHSIRAAIVLIAIGLLLEFLPSWFGQSFKQCVAGSPGCFELVVKDLWIAVLFCLFLGGLSSFFGVLFGRRSEDLPESGIEKRSVALLRSGLGVSLVGIVGAVWWFWNWEDLHSFYQGNAFLEGDLGELLSPLRRVGLLSLLGALLFVFVVSLTFTKRKNSPTVREEE